MLLSLLLMAASCPVGQTDVYGTGMGNGTISIWEIGESNPVIVNVKKGKKWTVCLAPTLPWKGKIDDERFTPFFDEVDVKIDGIHSHTRWAIPPQAKADASKIETDGALH